MKIGNISRDLLGEISAALEKVDERQVESLIHEIRGAKRVFCLGAGRSKAMLSAFCIRLNHLGYQAYVAGGIPCPPAEQGDLVITASGSGKTLSVISIINRAKEAGARTAMITASSEPAIADCVVDIAAPNSLFNKGGSRQLMRTLFEQVMFILTETLIIVLSKDIPEEEIVARHTNLE